MTRTFAPVCTTHHIGRNCEGVGAWNTLPHSCSRAPRSDGDRHEHERPPSCGEGRDERSRGGLHAGPLVRGAGEPWCRRACQDADWGDRATRASRNDTCGPPARAARSEPAAGQRGVRESAVPAHLCAVPDEVRTVPAYGFCCHHGAHCCHTLLPHTAATHTHTHTHSHTFTHCRTGHAGLTRSPAHRAHAAHLALFDRLMHAPLPFTCPIHLFTYRTIHTPPFVPHLPVASSPFSLSVARFFPRLSLCPFPFIAVSFPVCCCVLPLASAFTVPLSAGASIVLAIATTSTHAPPRPLLPPAHPRRAHTTSHDLTRPHTTSHDLT